MGDCGRAALLFKNCRRSAPVDHLHGCKGHRLKVDPAFFYRGSEAVQSNGRAKPKKHWLIKETAEHATPPSPAEAGSPLSRFMVVWLGRIVRIGPIQPSKR